MHTISLNMKKKLFVEILEHVKMQGLPVIAHLLRTSTNKFYIQRQCIYILFIVQCQTRYLCQINTHKKNQLKQTFNRIKKWMVNRKHLGFQPSGISDHQRL